MADDLTSRLQAQWSSRTPREQTFLGIGGLVLLLGLLYGLVYSPLMQTREKLQKRLPVQRAELRQISAQVQQIEHLRRKGGVSENHGPLLRQIESSAIARNLRPALKTLTPIGDDQLQIGTDAQPVETWTNWLDELERTGVRVRNLRLSITDPGHATLTATLSRGTQ